MDDNKILKYIQGHATREEKEEFLNWIDESDDNRQYYKKIRKIWDMSLITADYVHNPYETDFETIRKRTIDKDKHKSFKRRTLQHTFATIGKIAAVAVVAVFFSYFYFSTSWEKHPISYNIIEIPVGNQAKITLPDGSVAWLNSGTTLRYPEQFTGKDRSVQLNGEGWFDISKNKEKPFVVNTPLHSITVLGTTFNVYAYEESNHFETTLFEGSIILNNNNDKDILEMKPGQQAIYDKTTRKMTVYNNKEIKNTSSWISGYNSFYKTPFSQMLERLGQYYNKEIIIKRPEIATYECTGKFKVSDTLEHILDVVKATKPFKYEINEHQIIIY